MKCEVLYIERSHYEGLDPHCPWPSLRSRNVHRTWLTADFARRFHPAYMGPGWSSFTTTAIVAPGTQWTKDGANDVPMVENPRYAEIVERFVWTPLYWLRNRWNGLRHGLDRDRKS